MGTARITLLAGFFGGLALLGVACGDDDKPGTFTTGVDNAKPLGTLTPDEADKVCKSSQSYAMTAITEAKQRELTCRFTAIAFAATGGLTSGAMPPASGTPSDTELQASCQSAFDQCMMAAPGAPTANCQSFPATCMATVGEYEACLRDMPGFIDQTNATLPTCATVTRLSLITVLGVINTAPASCKTFQMKCGGAGIPGVGTPPTGTTTGP